MTIKNAHMVTGKTTVGKTHRNGTCSVSKTVNKLSLKKNDRVPATVTRRQDVANLRDDRDRFPVADTRAFIKHIQLRTVMIRPRTLDNQNPHHDNNASATASRPISIISTA